MSRLTKKFDSGFGHNECRDSCMTCCNGASRELAQAMIGKLSHYEDLEEQLEKLYGGKLSLDKVVETVNRVVQNGEEKLDYARILTNAEAEKWEKWKDLEEQGRLIELPCENVYRIMDYGSPDHAFIDSIPIETMPIYDLKHIDNGNIFFSTKEKAKDKLEERRMWNE